AWVPQAAARRVNRVAGWSQAISGLVYGGLWAFAPFDVALWFGVGAIVLGIAVMVGYCAAQARRGVGPAWASPPADRAHSRLIRGPRPPSRASLSRPGMSHTPTSARSSEAEDPLAPRKSIRSASSP